MLLLGALALIFPLVASLWLTVIVALVCLVAGVVSWITTLARARHLSGSHAFWRFVVATLLVGIGVWMLSRLTGGPAAAASQVSALALAIGVTFLVEGSTASVVSLSNRHVRGWGWGLINGVVTLGIGLLIFTLNTFALSRVLGMLVGISFLFSALDLLGFRASFHFVEGKRPSSAGANQDSDG